MAFIDDTRALNTLTTLLSLRSHSFNYDTLLTMPHPAHSLNTCFDEILGSPSPFVGFNYYPKRSREWVINHGIRWITNWLILNMSD